MADSSGAPGRADRAQAPAGGLVLRGFGVAFGARVVLASLALELPAQGVDVLMGPVHGGKSTLFKTLAGQYQGHTLQRQWGEVTLNGAPLENHHRPLLVAQHARLLNLPVWQVLRQPWMDSGTAPTRSTVEWQAWAAEQAHGHGLPLSAAALAGSLISLERDVQRQVLILAHALAARAGAGWLLVDEPTFGLEPAVAEGLAKWLRRLGQHVHLWVCLHHLQQARLLADRITLLGGGYILAHQDVQAFFQQPANDWVAQFLRSGSLAIPAPDARPEDLADGVVPPPPLPAEALRHLAEAARRSADAVPVSPPVPSLVQAPAPIPVLAPSPVAAPAPRQAPAPAPAEARQAIPARLPQPSREGVEMAAAVGQIILSNQQGPNGFRWIVPGRLAGTPAPGVVHDLDYDLDLLARAGITHLITLTETDLDPHALRSHGLANTHLSVFDGQTPSVPQMHLLQVRMQRLIQRQEVLAVHCKAGLGRTGLVLACWLIWEGGLSPDAALERLRRIDAGYVQTAEQENFLHTFEQDILRRLN